MENLYLFIILALVILAIADLIVGVSNDAVNFLSSAIGSKAVSFKTIMIIASFGIALGAIFSSGMMEVARKGIFNPEQFYFDEIMIIFLAVMITDIILLDFFNTLGLPTSTTVSIVFELLGAAVSVGLYKVWENNQSISEIIYYINYFDAALIILGIVLSVFIAFTIGAIVQWISRLILTFDYKKKSSVLSSIFGGLAITSITYFILIKGLKGTSYSGESINNIIENNTIQIILYSTIIWSLFSYTVIKFFKINIYKIIIIIGTFALALAFAGNDLVNFIGVPIAAWQSYELWVLEGLSFGIAPEYFCMEALSEDVQAPNLILFCAGVIMVITLWFSARAKNVLKTSIDLSDQSEIKERFKPNLIAKYLVNFSAKINNLFQKIIPNNLKESIENRFEPSNQLLLSNTIVEKPAFDMIRASVNLIVASILISIATSYKLPLSTTYVTFMVAMGTSLSDRAWGKESAVYRVSGVLNVIGGWFITAIVAFSAASIIAFLMKLSMYFIPFLLIITCYIIFRNYKRYNKQSKKIKIENEKIQSERKTVSGVIIESSKNIQNVIKRSYKIYSNSTDGISRNDLKLLKKNSKQVSKLNEELDELQENIFNYLKNNDEAVEKATGLYLIILEKLTETTINLKKISKKTLKHVEMNKRKLALSQIKNLLKVDVLMKENFDSILMVFKEKNYEKIDEILLKIVHHNENLQNYILTIDNTDNKSKSNLLHLELLKLSSSILISLKELLENFYSINSGS